MVLAELTSWRTRWRVYEYVRNSLWIVPFLCVVLAVALGLVLPTVDEHTNTTIGITFGADAARSVLGAIAGGMITFTGFVFSILLLAVQFGSSQSHDDCCGVFCVIRVPRPRSGFSWRPLSMP